MELGLAVGVDVSACLLPIATGFVLINTELGLYPGVRLSPVEEFRRLVVSATCTMIVWAVGVAVLTVSFSTWILFLLIVYFTSLFTLPICRGWTRRMLGRWTRWGFPVLVCGDDAIALSLHDWLSVHRHLGLRPVGVIANRETLADVESDPRYVGAWNDLNEVAVRKSVYWAVVVPPPGSPTVLSKWISTYLLRDSTHPCPLRVDRVAGPVEPAPTNRRHLRHPLAAEPNVALAAVDEEDNRSGPGLGRRAAAAAAAVLHRRGGEAFVTRPDPLRPRTNRSRTGGGSALGNFDRCCSTPTRFWKPI